MWQPLTNVSGNLVERVSTPSAQTEDLFSNVQVTKLISDLQIQYEEQREASISLSSSPESFSSSRISTNALVTSPQRRPGNAFKAPDIKRTPSGEMVPPRASKNWRKDRLGFRLGSSYESKGAVANSSHELKSPEEASESECSKEHQSWLV